MDVGTGNFTYFLRFLKKITSLPFQLIPTKIITPEIQIRLLFHTKHNLFKNFIPSFVIELIKLDPNLRSAASLSVFKKNLLKFIRPSPNSVFNYHNYKRIKYLTRLRLALSHLCEHKFKHNFQEYILFMWP